jgi:hypothetical protein
LDSEVVERIAKLISFAAEFNMFKHGLQFSLLMQAPIEIFRQMFSYLIVVNALLIQGVWIYIGRRGEKAYIDDLTNFRVPKSSLSRFYGWRVTQTANVVLEGLILEAVLLSTIVGFALLAGDIMILLPLMPLLVFVVFLTIVSIGQLARRVAFIVDKEAMVVKRIRTSEFKIEEAKSIVDDLSNAGQFADGRLWFVMFRISSQQNAIGWAVRDVLMEKGRTLQKQLEAEAARRESERPPSSEGPGIE